MPFYIAQAISILTAAVAVWMMQFKSMGKILTGQIVANVLTASTYFLLGGFSGAGVCFIAIVQSVVMFVFNKKQKQPGIALLLVFIALYIGCSVWCFTSFIDVFSALAAVFFAVSITQKSSAASRLWYAANPLCWMIYDVYTRAYGNFVIHLVVFLSTASAMLRLDMPKKGG